jgi:hypothetical protein
MADPVPRAREAYDEVIAATKACEKVQEDYRVGRATIQQVKRCDDRLARAHDRAYTVESGRVEAFRN